MTCRKRGTRLRNFVHGERNRAIHKCLPYWVDFLWGVLRDWCRCVILAHSFHICLIGLCHPLLGCLVDFVLLLPFRCFRLAKGCDLLDFGGDCVYRWKFSFLLIGTLRRIVPRFLEIETMHTRLTSFCDDWRNGHQLSLVLLLRLWWVGLRVAWS